MNEPLREQMKAMIPDLPKNWVKIVGDRMGIKPWVIYSYINGRRGEREHMKLIEINNQMKTLHTEYKKLLEQAIA